MKCAFPYTIEADLIQELPLVCYEGKIVIVEDVEILHRELPLIKQEKILGFDTETRPSFQKGKNYPISILQLCGDNCVWIIRLNALSENLREIYEILEDGNIIKAGIAINGDLNGLAALAELRHNGMEDISNYTRKMGMLNTGLKNLSAILLGVRVSKGAQTSNWANETLTERQIKYAATDAWISRELYLEAKRIYNAKQFTEPLEYPEPKKSLKGKIKHIAKKIRKIFISIKPSKSSSKKKTRKPQNNFSKNKKPEQKKNWHKKDFHKKHKKNNAKKS